MDNVDIVIIGAGVVGLAIAEKLSTSEKEIIVVEKHDGFGREASSRNSEVIHAGIYYPEESLKAQLCVAGSRMLYALCERQGIPFRKTGKIIVAGNNEEAEKINHLYDQGRQNGVTGLQLLTRDAMQGIEPNITGVTGLFSAETGIIDTHLLMKYLEHTAETNGVICAYNCEVVGITKNNGSFTVEIRDADDTLTTLQSAVVVNAAGLSSDLIARWAGIAVDEAGYRLYPCKGEYFSVANRHRGKLHHLVYPAPTVISLGTHVVFDLNGGIKLGPNALYVDTPDYDVDPSHQEEFYARARRFLPFIEPQDLSPDMAGIRPKLQKAGDPFRDFIVTEESVNGVPGLINCVGIESPGLTACLAIAERVKGCLS